MQINFYRLNKLNSIKDKKSYPLTRIERDLQFGKKNKLIQTQQLKATKI